MPQNPSPGESAPLARAGVFFWGRKARNALVRCALLHSVFALGAMAFLCSNQTGVSSPPLSRKSAFAERNAQSMASVYRLRLWYRSPLYRVQEAGRLVPQNPSPGESAPFARAGVFWVGREDRNALLESRIRCALLHSVFALGAMALLCTNQTGVSSPSHSRKKTAFAERIALSMVMV